MKTLVAVLALMSLSSVAALACTQDEMVAKTQEFATKLQALAQKDSKKATDVSNKISAESAEKTAKIKTVDDTCAYYDELIKLVSQ